MPRTCRHIAMGAKATPKNGEKAGNGHPSLWGNDGLSVKIGRRGWLDSRRTGRKLASSAERVQAGKEIPEVSCPTRGPPPRTRFRNRPKPDPPPPQMPEAGKAASLPPLPCSGRMGSRMRGRSLSKIRGRICGRALREGRRRAVLPPARSGRGCVGGLSAGRRRCSFPRPAGGQGSSSGSARLSRGWSAWPLPMPPIPRNICSAG